MNNYSNLRRNGYRGDKLIEMVKQAASAIEEVLEENAKLRRALVELDCGGGDYLTARSDIAALSGLPVMAVAWDEHIAEIKRKLEASPEQSGLTEPEIRAVEERLLNLAA